MIYLVILSLVCVARSLYLGFRIWNSHVTLVEAELLHFVLAGLQDSSMCAATGDDDCDCRKTITPDLCI